MNELYNMMSTRQDKAEKIALYPGTFNPFTIGHEDVVNRALTIFDKVIIAISINPDKNVDENALTKRLLTIRKLYEDDPHVGVVINKGLTYECAELNDCTVIIKGIRNAEDLNNEMVQAEVNRKLGNIETVFIPTKYEYMYVSSSLVRSLEKSGIDTQEFIPHI